MKIVCHLRISRHLSVAIGILLWTVPARADDFHWTGNGDGQSWVDFRNWFADAVPISDPQSTVRFGDAGSHYAFGGHVTFDYAANDPDGNPIARTDLGSFVFDNSSGALPSQLVVDVNGAPGTAYQVVTLYGGITLSNTTTTVAFNGGNSDANPNELKLGNDITLDVSAGATLRFESNLTISGSYGINKNGAGTLTLAGNNNFGNPGAAFMPSAFDGYSIFLNAGTLNVNSGLPARPVIISGGVIDNTSGQTIGGPFQTVWNGNFVYGGTSDLVFGKVAVTQNSTVNVAAGTLKITLALGAQDVPLYSGVNAVTKTGPGTLVLSGGSDSSTNQLGSLTVSQGLLVVGDPHDLGSTGNGVTIGDATLRIDGHGFKDDLHRYEVSSPNSTIEVINAAELNALGSSIQGSGSLTFRGLDNGYGSLGTLILDQPAGFTGGSVTIESGTLEARCDDALPSSAVLTIGSAGIYSPNQHRQTLAGLIINGDASIRGDVTVGATNAERSTTSSLGDAQDRWSTLSPRDGRMQITPDERVGRNRPERPSAAVVLAVTQTGTLSGSGSIDAGAGKMVIDGTLMPSGTIHLSSTSSDVGALTLSSTSIVSFGISNDTKDLVALTNTNLTLGGGALALRLPDTSSTGIDYSQSYTIFSGVNALTGTFGSVSGYDTADYMARFALSNGNYDLSFTPIPEPSTWIGGGLALLAIGYTQRRKLLNRGMRNADFRIG